MKLILLLILLATQFLFISCRQEVISPKNSLDNINEPQLSRTSTSYTFSINANNITETITDFTSLNTIKSSIHPVISEYSSGSVEIIIQLDQNNVLYSTVFDYNTNNSFTEIDGHEPKFIIFNFYNFTGKFKATLTDIK